MSTGVFRSERALAYLLLLPSILFLLAFFAWPLVEAILVAFGFVIWTRGFGPEDRELFRMRKAEIEELSLPDTAVGVDAPR